METVISLIQSVGFPIAVAVAMFVMLQGEQKEHKAESQQIRDAVTDLKIEFTETIHKMESQTTEAINNNTLVIQKLLDKIENLQAGDPDANKEEINALNAELDAILTILNAN